MAPHIIKPKIKFTKTTSSTTVHSTQPSGAQHSGYPGPGTGYPTQCAQISAGWFPSTPSGPPPITPSGYY